MKLTLKKFADCFAGVGGGERAVDKLRTEAQRYLSKEFESSSDCRIVVKAYANVDGLAQFLVKEGKLHSMVVFRSFVKEFTNRHPLCDFVDVWSRKRAC